MGFRNIKIDSRVQLNIKNQQLIISAEEERSIPLEDINCIMIENQAVTVSSYFIQKLAELGIALYVCDEKHFPNAVTIPLGRHSRHYKLLKAQMELGKPLQKRLWQQIVMMKVGNQAKCLELLQIDGYKELYAMVKEIQSGDRMHVEAKAAAFYFRQLFGSAFTRGEDHIINSCLNYGYAILRGMIARSIVCYGFEPSIGLFHRSELNSFNLADDLIEPFRPLVDLYVASKFDYAEVETELTPTLKRELFGIINFDMDVQGDKRIVSNCIDLMAGSLSSCMLGKQTELLLPSLMQLQVHSYE